MSQTDQRNPAGPIIIKLGGAVLDSAPAGHALWDRLFTLHTQHEGGVVVVHGGGSLVDRRLADRGHVTRKCQGLRITPDEHIEEVVATLAGIVSTRVTARLTAAGAICVGMNLSTGRTTTAERLTGPGLVVGRVGGISGGDPGLVDSLLASGVMPVFSSIALDDDHEPLNVNADDAAAALASVTDASAVVLLTDVAGVMDHDGSLIPELTSAYADRLVETGVISGGMVPKVRGAFEIARSARCPVAIAAWTGRGSILDAIAGRGGTTVLPDGASPSADTEILVGSAP